MRLRNGHWFSYPGYAEILLGEPHEVEIKSNDPIRNPFPTVLEAIRERHTLPAAKVATFGGWSVFNQIVEHYRGRTHMLITTDHGRGHTAKDWRDHGAKIVGANETWIAFASPKMAQRGVWKNHEPLSTSQVAATIAGWMGVDWNAAHPNAGWPIR